MQTMNALTNEATKLTSAAKVLADDATQHAVVKTTDTASTLRKAETLLAVAATDLASAATNMKEVENDWLRFALAEAATNLAHAATQLDDARSPSSVTALCLAQHGISLAEAATKLDTCRAPTKTDKDMDKIFQLIKLGQYGTEECSNRKAIRELIMHENEIHNNRRSFFTVVQGLLFTAAGLLSQSDGSYAEATRIIIFVVSGLGLFHSLVTLVTPSRSGEAITRLVNTLHDPFWPTPVIGRWPSPVTGPWPSKEAWLLFSRDWTTPLIFILAWIAFIVVLAVKSFDELPMEIVIVDKNGTVVTPNQ